HPTLFRSTSRRLKSGAAGRDDSLAWSAEASCAEESDASCAEFDPHPEAAAQRPSAITQIDFPKRFERITNSSLPRTTEHPQNSGSCSRERLDAARRGGSRPFRGHTSGRRSSK